MPKEKVEKDGEVQNIDSDQTFSTEEFKELVTSFQDVAKAMEASTRAAAPAPVVETGPTEAEVTASRESAAKEYNTAREKANELAAAGDVAAANELQWQAYQKLSQATANPDDNPTAKTLKALSKQAEAIAKGMHTEAFKEWGDEIKGIVTTLPTDQQLDPASWESAVQTVRARHVDEIIEREREALKKELAEGKPIGTDTLVAGAGTRSTGDSTDDLTPEQIKFCLEYKLDQKWYADSVKRYNAAPEGKLGVSILDEDVSTLKVAPGKF